MPGGIVSWNLTDMILPATRFDTGDREPFDGKRAVEIGLANYRGAAGTPCASRTVRSPTSS